MSNRAAVFFTFKSVEHLLRDGGTSSWRLNSKHARKCSFAICTRNAEWKHGAEGSEPHRSAFLVARIRDLVPSPDNQSRYLVRFSEYAQIDLPDIWKKRDRNPVRYTTLEELGIDLATLKWKPMGGGPEPPKPSGPPEGSKVPLTMAEAKKGLALAFGVPVDAIEITIRA